MKNEKWNRRMKKAIKLASAVVGLTADIILVLESIRRFIADKSSSNQQSNSKNQKSWIRGWIF